MGNATAYFAHSGNDQGAWNPLRAHLKGVAERARGFAELFGAADDAYLAGLFHDLGKYGDLFQERLKGNESGLDHWSMGASVCLERYRSDRTAMAVQGHHLGLQWWEKEELRKLLPGELERHIPEGRRLTERDRDVLLERLRADGLTLPERAPGLPTEVKCAAAMLDLRMLFSAVTDADYLATEAHFNPEAARMREPAAELRPGEAAEVLDRHLEALAARADSSPAVAAMRRDLLDACRAAAESAPGLFTLTAPTGGGKTLSTLAFALRHAEKHGLRRIVVVMPFLSIIDQTVGVYREALAEMAGDDGMQRYLLEHHSLAAETAENDGEIPRLRGMLAQNWDAPIIITTSVQFLESLLWPRREERVGWGELAGRFADLRQVLCVVNLKKHARDLFHLLEPRWGADAFHLSTAMCPKHRAAVLMEVRGRLERGERCALVATQCVEAGVDLDFPAAFRALGPLDAIAQVAGRCNRNGKLEAGVLRVFVPEGGGYPMGGYKQAADLTAILLNRAEGVSIDDPAAFDEYFRSLYSVAKLEHRPLLEAIQTRDFREVRKHYRIIEQDSVNVLVAYDRARYEELSEEARRKGLSRDWVMRARPHAVSCFRRATATAMVESVRLKDRTPSGDWFLYLCHKHYHPGTGLHIPTELEYLEG